MLHFIGIDPGLGGAIAILRPDGTCASCVDTPVAVRVDSQGRDRRDYALADIRTVLYGVQQEHGVVAAVEAVHAFPDQGVSSMFAFGRGLGIVLGMLAGLQIQFIQVTPVAWKRKFGLLNQGKGAARLLAQQRWPTTDLSKKRHDGRADALFLAEYARREHQGLTWEPALGAPTKGDDHGGSSAAG